MRNQTKFHALRPPALVRGQRFVLSLSGMGFAVLLAPALTARAQTGSGNLYWLNRYAEAEFTETAAQAYGNVSYIVGPNVSPGDFLNQTAQNLTTELNNDWAAGDVNNLGPLPPGHTLHAGRPTISQQAVQAAQAAYVNNLNAAQLLANIYAGFGVNFQGVLFVAKISPVTVPPPATLRNPYAPAGAVAPGTPAVQVTTTVFQTMIMEKMGTVDEQNAAPAQNGNNSLISLHPIAEATAFFEQSSLKAGGNRELYGVDVGVDAATDRVKGWLTLPLQGTTYSSTTYMTYGVDAGLKYEVIQDSGLYLGAHGTYLGNTGTGSYDDYDWQVGPFAGYTYKIGSRYSLSLGALADFIRPELIGDTWLGGFGANLGVRLTDHIALNTYYTYWRNLGSGQAFLGVDWHDVGVELAYNLGKSWRLVAGAVTSLGYEGYDSDYQVYLGTGWQFEWHRRFRSRRMVPGARSPAANPISR
jgi:hypothetical protein